MASKDAAGQFETESREGSNMRYEYEDVSMELDLGEPPQEVMEYAREHLGENEDSRARTLQELKDLIYQRGEVDPHRMDDDYLIRFLRARNFIVERAHRLLVNYYQFKENNSSYVKGVNPIKLTFLGDDDVISVLPYREQCGRRILIYRIGNWKPSRYVVDELFKASLIVLELAILEQRAQILGGICIFDLGGISLQHAWNVTPSVASRVIEMMGASFPIRTQAIHIVNQSWIFDMIFTIFKPLLDERMRDRIHFHGSDMESLHAHINPKFLPEKYGGVRPEYNYKEWLDKLHCNKKVIDEIRSLGYIVEDKDIDIDDTNTDTNTDT